MLYGIWSSKGKTYSLQPRHLSARVLYFRQRRCFVAVASASSSSLWIELDKNNASRSKGFPARDPCLSMAGRTRLMHWPKRLRWGSTLILSWVPRLQRVGFGRLQGTHPLRGVSPSWLWMNFIWWPSGGVVSVHSMHNSLSFVEG